MDGREGVDRVKDDLIKFIEYIDGDVPEYIKNIIKVIEENHNNNKFRVALTARKRCWLELVEVTSDSKILGLNADFLVLDEYIPSMKQIIKHQG